MSDLADFLLARIAEDEGRVDGAYQAAELDHPFPEDVQWYIDRMARECEAKRRIIYISERAADRIPPKGDGWEEARARQTLRHLATVYADHPDYREVWRP